MNALRFKLLFDGGCPLCRREARFLQRRNRHGYLAFEDITSPGFDPAVYHTTREELMGVIHGVFPDERIVRKVEAFREAYRAIGLGWLLAPTGWPGLRWLTVRGYEWFARNRLAVRKHRPKVVWGGRTRQRAFEFVCGLVRDNKAAEGRRTPRRWRVSR
jgi:predicted DCC family thiol-disulfide oxidoreductase YuxK